MGIETMLSNMTCSLQIMTLVGFFILFLFCFICGVRRQFQEKKLSEKLKFLKKHFLTSCF